jgi:hypothetical protein
LSEEAGVLVARNAELREEQLVNHHVGKAKGRDVWEHLLEWEIKVGQVGIFSTHNERVPWVVGDIVEIIASEEGKSRCGDAVEHYVIHERGYEKAHTKKELKAMQDGEQEGPSEEGHECGEVDFYASAGNSRIPAREWTATGKHYWRYQQSEASGVKVDVYSKNKTKAAGMVEVRSTHNRDAIAYWAMPDLVFKGNGYLLRNKILEQLSNNSNVKWKKPEERKKKSQSVKPSNPKKRKT